MTMLTKALELGIVKPKIESLGLAGHFRPIDYLASPDRVFVSEYINGSHQYNDGDRITYDSRAIALALFQEIGLYNIRQCSQKQADALHSYFVQFVDYQRQQAQQAQGSKHYGMPVYNRSQDRLERGNKWFNPPIPTVYKWAGNDTIIVKFGNKMIGVSRHGALVVK